MIIEQIATSLGLPQGYILNLSNGASHNYKTYQIKKKNGGLRVIHHPSRKLKAVQNWLLKNVLASLPVHDAATAYRVGRSIYYNALVHSNSRYLLRIDLSNFFPSITADDFARYASTRSSLFSGWTAEDLQAVARLLFLQKKLTIGAPTSPSLANILCYEVDCEIEELCKTKDVVYTRYADDLFFSCDAPNVLGDLTDQIRVILNDAELPANLSINPAKTVHSSKKKNRQVTGITLGSDGKPHVPRKYKRLIRSQIFKYEELDDRQKVSLTGMISYVAGCEPDFINRLISKYGFEKINYVMTLRPLEERQRLHALRS